MTCTNRRFLPGIKVTDGLPWSLWALTTICHQLGLDQKQIRSQGTWSTCLMTDIPRIVSQHFLEHWLNWGTKPSFCLEQEFGPNSYNNIMTDKMSQFKDSQFKDSRFEFWVADRSQFGRNCDPYLPSTTKLVQHCSMVFSQFTCKLLCTFWSAIIYNLEFRIGVLSHQVDQLGWASH
jgi:hypothetical protein